MISRFAAVIMNTFPAYDLEKLMWKISFQQFFLLHDRAVELRTGKRIDLPDSTTADEIKSGFVYDEEKKRWVKDG